MARAHHLQLRPHGPKAARSAAFRRDSVGEGALDDCAGVLRARGCAGVWRVKLIELWGIMLNIQTISFRLGYTRGGQGGKVERIYREVRGMAIPGGSEEILLDLGVRQASKLMPKL